MFPGFCATRRFITVFNNDPPPARVTSQINPFHDLIFYVLKINFKIILPSEPMSSDWSLSFRFPHQTTARVSLLRHGRHIFHSFQVLDLITIHQQLKKLLKYWKLYNTFKPTLVPKCSRVKEHNALALPFFYMAAKFGPLEKKRIKND
jgi:hypothetical protein